MLELLDAWKSLGLDATLCIVGDIDPELRNWAKSLACARHVEFLPFTDKIEQLYAAADIFVLPTHEEGDPKVTYEAAACGLPVITTPMGAGRIIKDGVNGCVVREGDVVALGRAMAFLAKSPEVRRAYGERARADAAAFTYDHVARGRASMLKDLLPRRRPTGFRPHMTAAEPQAQDHRHGHQVRDAAQKRPPGVSGGGGAISLS